MSGLRLGMNARRLTARRTGVGRYVEYLAREWASEGVPFGEVRLYTERPIENFAAGKPFRNVVVKPAHPGLVWENWALPRAARGDDLFFSPAYTLPLGLSMPAVVTIHDVGQIRFRNAFPWWAYYRYAPVLRRSARRADAIIAVSQAIKRDVVEHLGVPPSKIEVIYYGIDPLFRPADSPEPAAKFRARHRLGDDPLLLFVGLASKFRQTPELVESFAMFKRRTGAPHRLMLVGPEMFGLSVATFAARFGVAGDVLHIPYLDHPDLVDAYRAADLLVYPSLSAGFPMPAMEAMASGLPVIVARIPALTEFVADAGAVFSSTSPSAIASEIESLVSQPKRLAELRRRGLVRAAQFSWRRCASETRDLLIAAASAGRQS